MPLELKSFVKQLSEIPAPSGHEAPARTAIRAAWAGLVDRFETDGLGSLIAVKHGTGDDPRRRIMLCAHMDEIGLIAAEINDGFIRADKLGGIDTRVLLSQPVLVHGRRVLQGVFGAAPPHMARSRKTYPELADLWIDVGLPADEVAALVRVGDIITFDAPATDLKGRRIAGKSLDNRASIAALTLCLDELSRRAHRWDVVAVASVQEEVHLLGAMTSAYRVAPDLAIAIDTTFGMQPGVGDDEGFALGGGPTLGLGPNFHPRLFDGLRKTARTHEIKLQTEVLPSNSGTDAWMIQVSRTGVPTALLSIPIRNMHTPSEVVDLRDIERTGRLMAAFITEIGPDFLDEISLELAGCADDEGDDDE
ncbi:M20/M25/M40 family metallo-hydrolase [Aggregatilinea lenta]|uniref:M20/M25/M40 family metallo-hydrolase n=1 Tax=Aggregatilinea lenta TaxID=913108 RepID=UPI000E5A1425|nr:M20/M25/M40 family metallo-hydrolase [Aggregatilinea lenta]